MRWISAGAQRMGCTKLVKYKSGTGYEYGENEQNYSKIERFILF